MINAVAEGPLQAEFTYSILIFFDGWPISYCLCIVLLGCWLLWRLEDHFSSFVNWRVG